MKAWVSFFFVALYCVSSHSLAADALTLSYDDLDEIIRKNNKSIESSMASTSAARARVGTVEQTFLPQWGAEVGIAQEREANGSGDTAPFWKVDVQANVYRGGRDELSVLVRNSQILIKEMDTQAQFRSELFKAKLDYIRLATVRKAIELTRSSTDDYEGVRKSILRKVEAGLMTATSAQAIQLEVSELKRQLIILKSEESELEDRLALILGIAVDQRIVLGTEFPSILPIVNDDMNESSFDNVPEVRRFSLLRESAALENSVRREQWLPDVSVFAAYTGYRVEAQNEFRSLPERELSIGVRFTVDLQNKRALDSELVARKSDMAAYEAQRDYLRRDVEHKVHEYRREIQTHGELIKTYDEDLAKSERLLKQLRGEFERGLGSSSEITGVIRSLYETKRKRIESVNQFHLARAGLETMKSL